MKANDQYGQFTGPAEVRLVRTLPGPIERVWEYLTDSVHDHQVMRLETLQRGMGGFRPLL